MPNDKTIGSQKTWSLHKKHLAGVQPLSNILGILTPKN